MSTLQPGAPTRPDRDDGRGLRTVEVARIRSLKIAFFKDEDLATLPFEHRLLFGGLWLLADREGRLQDRPKFIKAELFPYDDNVNVDKLLNDLAREKFVLRYEVAGRRFLAIRTFLKHQRPHHTEPPSEYPAPPHSGDVGSDSGDVGSLTVGSRDGSTGSLGVDHGSGNGSLGDLGLLPDLASNEQQSVSFAPKKSLVAKPADSPTVLTFPTVGRGPVNWRLSQSQLADWCKLYPNVDVLAEAKKALGWVKANPQNRKTANGMPRFIVNWLNRATDRQRGSRGSDRETVAEHNMRGLRSDIEDLMGRRDD